MKTDTHRSDESASAASGRASVGPLLYFQGMAAGRVALSALFVVPSGRSPPALETEDGAVAAATVDECDGRHVFRYAFSLRMSKSAWYAVDDTRYTVDTALNGDMRIAFVSCNGQEEGDLQRARDERNALWRRLARQHESRPFQLLLFGGDQIYADEILDVHPLVRAWADGASKATSSDAAGALENVTADLRRAFFRRYLEVLSEPETAWVMARVPALAMWDDHDICDGWGSMRESKLEAPVGRTLFAVARKHFLTFQLGADPHQLPDICLDPGGATLSWHLRLPHLHLIAPDLRSERRPNRVMGEAGWTTLERALASVESGRVLLLSSVPALGPHLSWVETLMHLTPKMEKYEDDLRDQWQSRAHRAEWRRFLERLAAVHRNADTPVTLLSGEIHLATRGTFDVPPAPMHQLVASGIAHPAPPAAYGRALGILARFGETPVPGHAIRLHPLPGRKSVYTAQRNYLVLERQSGAWRAWWELEKDGPTLTLEI